MDKETLSNYGWIVICVLVLAVMLAFASPFGTFIADGFKATYTGLFDTGDSALDVGLNAVGVKNTLECGHGRKEAGDHSQKECGHYNCQDTDCGCVPASCGVDGHWSGDGKDHSSTIGTTLHTGHAYVCQCDGWVVPEGGTYTSTVSYFGTYNSGEQIHCTYDKHYKDTFAFGDYIYTYNNPGWVVSINTNITDKNQTSYGPILDTVFNEPVTSINNTFAYCSNMITAPEIPETVTDMSYAFQNCTSLIEAPVIPDGVTNMNQTFYMCKSLVSVPNLEKCTQLWNMEQTFAYCNSLLTASTAIPANVQRMNKTFSYCTSLTTAPDISNCTKLTNMDSTFRGCTNLKTYHGSTDADGDLSKYIIPSAVTDMDYTFESCKNLTIAPEIPEGVTSMNSTFMSCTALQTVFIIPSTVTNMNTTFWNCSSLSGTVIINASPTNYEKCFAAVYFGSQGITLTGLSTKLDSIGATGFGYCAECNGKCQGNH